jgi:hypothetical protein
MAEPWLYVLIVLSLIAGVFLFRSEILFLLRHKKTEGTIVNWLKAKQKGKDFFYPLIAFDDENGTPIQFRAEERCEGSPMYPPGTKVTIKYISGNQEFRKVKYPTK